MGLLAGALLMFGVATTLSVVLYARHLARADLAAAGDISPLEVTVDFAADNACSRLSPLVEVDGLLQDSDLVCLAISDLTNGKSHGRSCVLPPHDETINAGAFLRYRAPCAQQADHRYRFQVYALDAYERPISSGEAHVTCCRSLLDP
ncbi:MAG: hypothetical protein GVY33_11500 [Alphaproteobacteria bacterium]|jgi:hypothetical protein|nr:hypothetical protein [Alphaproteobacteria bacterium]